VSSLLWVAQFFTDQGESSSVICLKANTARASKVVGNPLPSGSKTATERFFSQLITPAQAIEGHVTEGIIRQ
jgi:hypothetical protein